MKYNLEQKYEFLLSLFKARDIDIMEFDAMFSCHNSAHYFVFEKAEDLLDMDRCVELVMSYRENKGKSFKEG